MIMVVKNMQGQKNINTKPGTKTNVEYEGNDLDFEKDKTNKQTNITLTPLGPTGPARPDSMDPSAAMTCPGSPFSP